ncbi:hypothetical protein HMPREF0063_11777 [Aeromicrobium marinum DSM 15272]|uniref:Uncharacterized protein n=1 Tax=Aeromicrobium marinum DSM 15272 TaxID=585531 RepID=E2SDJ1_9ACTN|nr:hypothetical protein HMPREF0063_11777 [Aeromicrobium marinum DSM 15272]
MVEVLRGTSSLETTITSPRWLRCCEERAASKPLLPPRTRTPGGFEARRLAPQPPSRHPGG